MTQNKLYNIIMSLIDDSDFGKFAYISVKPKQGWELSLTAPITNILNDYKYTFISNAFSDGDAYSFFKVQRFIESLSEYKYRNSDIAFEIYSYNGKTNEQIVIVSDISESDIKIVKNDCDFIIEISIDYIKPSYSTK